MSSARSLLLSKNRRLLFGVATADANKLEAEAAEIHPQDNLKIERVEDSKKLEASEQSTLFSMSSNRPTKITTNGRELLGMFHSLAYPTNLFAL
ncbi:hypothetical protein M3Y98_01135400 [Aphelenchoides besseyi]|nr:hypothetical protein M3Y98_01135400 [Aphelenchoides besseyi]